MNPSPRHRIANLIARRAAPILGLAVLAAIAAGAGLARSARAQQPAAAPVGYEKRWPDREFKPMESSCFNCHTSLSGKTGRPARDHVTSAHFRAGVTCHECHGGDPTKDEHEEAHDKAKGFVGALDKKLMMERCAVCHQTEVKTFMASKHFPAHQGVRDVSCVTCHSAHQIGARNVDFSWPKTCAECHELDKVVPLPDELIDMMKSKDQIVGAMRTLRVKLENKPYPADVMEPYREVRQLSGDVVHATSPPKALEASPKVIEKNKALAAKIEALLAK